MKYLIKPLHLILLIPIVSMFSCNNDDDLDTTPPQIQNLRLNGTAPEAGVTVQAGSTLQISADLTDNEGVSSARVNIHDDFDAHNHKLGAAPFTFDTTLTLSGTSLNQKVSVNIPANVAGGPYHLTMQLLDNSGNEASPAIADFSIISGSEPTINITSDLTAEFHQNDTLNLQGSITDPDGLAEIQIIVEDHDSGTVIFSADFDLTGTETTWDMETALQAGNHHIILNSPGDHAELIILAKDQQGNLSIQEQEIHIH